MQSVSGARRAIASSLSALYSAGLALALASTGAVAALGQDVDIVSITAAANMDGRPEIFAVGANGNLYHRWRLSPVALAWSDWTLFATGQFTKAIAQPGHDKGLYLFGLNAGQLVVRKQASPGGGWLTESLQTGTQLRDIAVAKNQDDRFQVLAVGGNGALWTISGPKDKSLAASSWSEWSQLGGDNLVAVVAERDGDGRVTAVALGADHRARTTRQFSPNELAVWTEWLSLGQQEVGELALGRGSDRKLWLVEAGLHNGLVARALAATTPAPPPEEVRVTGVPSETQRVTVRPPRPPATVVVHPPSHTDVRLKGPVVLATPDAWSGPQVFSDRPLLAFSHLSIGPDSGGALEVFSIAVDFIAVASRAPNKQVLRFVQGKTGAWSTGGTALRNSPVRVKEFATLAFASGRDGTDATFATDGRNGRAWVMTRKGGEQWNNQSWHLLGKIPGANAPDLTFQIRACLEGALGIGNADVLRTQIADGVSANLATAFKGTPIESLVVDPTLLAQCTPPNEGIGLWLSSEVYPPALVDANIFPRDDASTFAVLVREATIRKVFAEIWRTLPKSLDRDGKPARHGDITLSGYDVVLREPNQLELSIAGSMLSVGFHVRATATFSVLNRKPTCTAQVKIDDANSKVAGITWAFAGFFMALPYNYFTDRISGLEQGRLAAQGPLLCKISDALLSELYLPIPADPTKAQVLEVPYDKVRVVAGGPNSGVLGFGLGRPTTRTRVPRVDLKVELINQRVGLDRILMRFTITPTDLKQPFTRVEWTPSYPGATRVVTPTTLNTWPQALTAIFEYVVTPSRALKYYDLGAMTVTVTGADGLAMNATEGVSPHARPTAP